MSVVPAAATLPSPAAAVLAALLPLAASGAAPVAPPVTALAFAPGGGHLVVGSQAGIEVRAWPSLRLERRLDTGLAHVDDLAFSPDGRRLAAAGGTPSDAGTVEVRSWPDGRVLHARTQYDDLVYAVAWSPDSRLYACASHDRRGGIHDGATGKLIHVLEGHSRPVLAVCFTAGGGSVVTAGAGASLRVWDAATGACRRILDNHTRAVHALAAAPRGASPRGGSRLALVASASADRTVRIWQPEIGRLVRFARLDAVPLAIAWLPSGDGVAAVCDDGTARVIDPETVELRATVRVFESGWATSVAVAPAGASAAAGGEGGRVVRIDLGSRKEPETKGTRQ